MNLFVSGAHTGPGNLEDNSRNKVEYQTIFEDVLLNPKGTNMLCYQGISILWDHVYPPDANGFTELGLT